MPRPRRTLDFYDLVQRCERRIDILTLSLVYFVSVELPCGLNGPKMTLLQMICDALPHKHEHFGIRILTLDPDSNFTNERAATLGRDRRQFREEVRGALTAVREFVESADCASSMQLKTYDAWPLQMNYFFDNVVVSSVLAHGRTSRGCLTYVHSLKASGAGETYERHFEKVWSSAQLSAQSANQPPLAKSWKPDGNPRKVHG